MMIRFSSCLFVILMSCRLSSAQTIVAGTETILLSPDKNMAVKFYQKSDNEGKKAFYYQVSFKNKTVRAESVMELQLDNHLSESAMVLPIDKRQRWFENLKVTKISASTKDTTWKPVYGERDVIRDHFNATTVESVKDDNPIYLMNIELRAYNEGVAFRFFFPENEKGTYYRVMAEDTEFTLLEGTKVWVAKWAQAYGKQKGIGVWLYVNQQALLMQSDSLFSIYKKWGVAGVKFGFVQSGSHRWTTWIEKAIQQAAANQIMVNIHDDWRPTGEQRTWPNLMTAEGIRGNEEMPDATSNTVMPFTRYISGAADYTICYFDKRIKTTHGHQLALAAIYFSPLQTLYWYDKPAYYHHEPELEFWHKIPVTWDETRVLQGIPGKFVSVVRRNGDQWFMGTITNTEARTIKLKFDFLPKGKTYLAKVYSDDDKINTATKVGITTKKVDANTVLEIKLKASGGQSIWLQPKL